MNDFRAISLPEEIREGLILLTRRALLCEDTRNVGTLGDELLSEARQVAQVLFGDDPLFGSLHDCETEDVRAACKRVSAEPASELAPRAYVRLLKAITPSVAVCPECGELALNDVGGKLETLAAGHLCLYCTKVQLGVIPMTLRMLAWTDGRLVDAGTDVDVTSRPGKSYPLRDELIIQWAGDPHPDLLHMLQEGRVSIYGLLAFLNLRRKMFKTLDEARTFLCDSHAFGITTRTQVQDLACRAAAFLAEREVTNVATPSIAHRLGRKPTEAQRIVVAGRTYLIEGRIGRGGKCDVFRALWDHTPTERVVVKVLRALDDADLLQREVRTLKFLRGSTVQGAEFFRRIIPELIASGRHCGPDGIDRPVTVCRHKNLHDWTLADVLREYPEGVDAETAVWMWNRLLMLLAWVHRNGFVHGAIIPKHVLLHVRNHGATLLDWSCATRYGRNHTDIIPVISAGQEDFYPDEVLGKRPPTPATDIAMSARCVIAAAGGDPRSGRLPESFPQPLAHILADHARCGSSKSGLTADALELFEEFKQQARSVFGKSRYHVFHMPRT